MGDARSPAGAGGRISSPAVTVTALASAVRWGAHSTQRLGVFHLLFMHALSSGSAERLVLLWPRIPPGYTLPSVLLALRSALVHPVHPTSASRAPDIPAAVIAPALDVLTREHMRALDDMTRLWRENYRLKNSGGVLRSWGGPNAGTTSSLTT